MSSRRRKFPVCVYLPEDLAHEVAQHVALRVQFPVGGSYSVEQFIIEAITEKLHPEER